MSLVIENGETLEEGIVVDGVFIPIVFWDNDAHNRDNEAYTPRLSEEVRNGNVVFSLYIPYLGNKDFVVKKEIFKTFIKEVTRFKGEN